MKKQSKKKVVTPITRRKAAPKKMGDPTPSKSQLNDMLVKGMRGAQPDGSMPMGSGDVAKGKK